MNDVIIIGGSFAGLAAALQLGRARRKVTVLDTGLPRNRFAGHSHGLLGHDHKPPLHILAEARQQLARYPTIRLVNARADRISGAIDDFSVLTGNGESLGARRLILSYGVVDQMSDVPGFAEGSNPTPHRPLDDARRDALPKYPRRTRQSPWHVRPTARLDRDQQSARRAKAATA